MFKLAYIMFLMLGVNSGWAAPQKEQNSSFVYWGEARRNSGEIAYTEKHTILKDTKKIIRSTTEYFLKDKKTKIALLESDYLLDSKKPTYRFKDLRSGYQEGLRHIDGEYYAYVKKDGEKEKSKLISSTDTLFSCQGWHYYLVKNFEIFEGKSADLSLILPSQLDYFKFKITGSRAVDGMVVAKLEISNWFLRLVAPSLKLVYDKKNSRLVKYEGVSNLLTDQGEQQNVTIKYFY